jgi:hypothetical protein
VVRHGVQQGPALTRGPVVPVACALAALAAAGATVLASLAEAGWQLSALVRMHDTLPLARLALRDDPRFVLRHHSGFYDGAFFYAQARDPMATGQAHRLLAGTPYYWGHPGYGWLAWLASVGGHPSAIPAALLAVGLLAITVAGAAASLLSSAVGWTPWGGLAVALNPGLLFAVANDTSESVAAALLATGLVAYIRGRRTWALVLFAALCFAKEPLVLVPLAIAAWELWRWRRPPVVALAVVPVVLWWLYIRIQLGSFPFGHAQGGSRLGWPFAGWVRAVLDAASQSWGGGIDTAQLGQAAVPLIVATALAILVAAARALPLRSPVDPPYLVLAALYACIVSTGVQYPKDLIRELALVLLLLPFAIAARPTAPPRPEPASARTRPRARRAVSPRRGS